MIHELRIYTCPPGRLSDLLNRFQNYTLKVWKKHGIRQVGFWTNTIGNSNNELFYLLEWESLEDRELKWEAFVSDPEWIEIRALTEKNGPIVANIANSILQPTSFSSIQ